MTALHWAFRSRSYSQHIILILLSRGGSLDLNKKAMWKNKKPLHDFPNLVLKNRLENAVNYKQEALLILDELGLRSDELSPI